MDYEKLHKDTIAKLHQMVNSGKITVKTACSICADFVPESGDERVRKEIIATIHLYYGEPLEDEAKEMIGWLEKQGNLMKALQISNERIGELIEENYYLKEQLEKQGKHDMGISEATKQKLEDNLNKALEKETPESFNEFLDEQNLANSAKTCNDEQVPAKWHREDEQNLNACLGYIPDEYLRRWLTDAIHAKYDKPAELPKGEDYGIDGLYAAIDILQNTLGKVDGYQSDDGILEHKCAISAVKELSKQQKPWSEENKKMSRFIGNAITTNGASIYLKSKGIQVIDAHVWLNGFKERVQPQNTWRPSDEQIGALESAISLLQRTTLESLCNELKKLREE